MEGLLEIYDSIAKNLALIIGNDTDPVKLLAISPALEKHIFYLSKYVSHPTKDRSLNSSANSLQDHSKSALDQTLDTHIQLLMEFATKINRLNMRKYNFVTLNNLSS